MLAQFDEALSDFTSAIRIDAKHPDAYKRRGQVLAALGKVRFWLRKTVRFWGWR
jgi:hypothetical protein